MTTWQDLERTRVLSGAAGRPVSWTCTHARQGVSHFSKQPTPYVHIRRTVACCDCGATIRAESYRCNACRGRQRRIERSA
jgi:hypothetical protein